ncbi:hypothetical protein [Flexivirga sp. B27]
MTELTRRQVSKGAAWVLPVVAVASAAPAAAASENVDYCGCFLPAGLQLLEGRWVSSLVPMGVSWHVYADLTMPPCPALDVFEQQHGPAYLGFTVSQLSVQTTEGPLEVNWNDMLGARVIKGLPTPTDLHFDSADWEIGSTPQHHVTTASVTVNPRLTNSAGSVDVTCPGAIRLDYTFGPDEYGNWEGNSGLVTVTVS